MSETLRWNRAKIHDLCNEITEIVNMTSPLPKAIFRWASILLNFVPLGKLEIAFPRGFLFCTLSTSSYLNSFIRKRRKSWLISKKMSH